MRAGLLWEILLEWLRDVPNIVKIRGKTAYVLNRQLSVWLLWRGLQFPSSTGKHTNLLLQLKYVNLSAQVLIERAAH